jgi:hypothetical protein
MAEEVKTYTRPIISEAECKVRRAVVWELVGSLIYTCGLGVVQNALGTDGGRD